MRLRGEHYIILPVYMSSLGIGEFSAVLTARSDHTCVSTLSLQIGFDDYPNDNDRVETPNVTFKILPSSVYRGQYSNKSYLCNIINCVQNKSINIATEN